MSGHVPDVGRRVLQCACGRTRAWAGEEGAREGGWSRTWTPGVDGELAAAWTCPDCWKPPASPPPVVQPRIPAFLWALISDGPFAFGAEQFDLVCHGDPARGAAYLAEFATKLGSLKEGTRLRWAAYLRRAGVEVPEIRTTSIKPRQKWQIGADVLQIIKVEWLRGADARLDEIARCRDTYGAERLVSCSDLIERGRRLSRAAAGAQ